MNKIQALTQEGHRRVHQFANIHQEEEIQKLSMFLMENYQGRLNGDKTPVDVAIELLERRCEVNKNGSYGTIEGLRNLKTDINQIMYGVPLLNRFRKSIQNRIDSVIIDILDDDCSNCPVMNKMDRLTEAIEQGYMIAEKSNTPFKISCVEREIGGCLD